jgi:voltage-gated potassium channel
VSKITDTLRIKNREAAIQRWEKHSAIPLAILALAFLALWAVQVLAPLTGIEFDIIEGLIVAIWATFIVDYAVRFTFHADKIKFIRSSVIEIIALLVPAFRFLRVLRVVTAVGILTRVVQSLQGRVNLYIAIVFPMLVFAGSLGVFEAERSAPGSNITTFEDAIWWAAVTVFTVGYGDLYPITLEGRFIAVILMMGGVALLSVLTANLASYFLRQARNPKS